jgi:hypothetical protein
MKLQTYIQPRRDGTVTAVGEDGRKHVFTAALDGALVCDVACEATIARLLASGNFEPVDADDFDKAIALAKAAPHDEHDVDPDDLDDDFSEEVSPGGIPVEANTAPVHRRAGRQKSK